MVAEPWEAKWEVVGNLSGGGQGTTRRVRSRGAPPVEAVLKTLVRPYDPQARARMNREAAALSQVQTVGGKVPQILDSNTHRHAETDVPLYFVMEYIPGNSLAKFVKEKGKLPFEQAICMAIDLCETVVKAHGCSVLHRDLKPDNIIVRNEATYDLVVVDFGLAFNAEADSDLTRTSEAMGNRFLRLPELNVQGEDRRDVRSDLTCICALLHYCLAGVEPGQLLDPENKLPHRRKVGDLSTLVTPPARVQWLNALFDRGLANRSDDRFQAATDLLARLRELVDLTPTAAGPKPDLVEVARQESARLRTESVETKRNRFRQALTRPYKELNEWVSELAFTQLEEFSVQAGGNQLPELPELRDQLIGVQWVFTLKAEGHDCMLSVNYFFASDGDECAIYRAIKQDTLSGFLEGWHLVFRYPGAVGPDVGALTADLEGALAKCMELFGQQSSETNDSEPDKLDW